MSKKKTNGGGEEKAPAFNRYDITTQTDAKKLATEFLPNEDKRYQKIVKDGKEVMVDMYDIMYVTQDGNVFFKQNEGSAFNHAKKNDLKHFIVKFD